jgi:nitrogen regulatory protein PII
MKFVIITAIKEFEQEIKEILKKSGVNTYSYKNVTGYRDSTQDSLDSNWFATEMNENESILFYAVSTEESADKIYSLINHFNKEEKTLSQIHIAILQTEKTI